MEGKELCIGRKPSKITVDPLLCISTSAFCTPLPCREAQISMINEFIDQFFVSNGPMILSISGKEGTGKTSSINLCRLMTPYENRIRIIDCNNESPFQEFDIGTKQLIVLDHFEDFLIIIDLLNYYCREIDNGLIIISRMQIPVKLFPNDIISNAINFGQYSSDEIITILKETILNSTDIISEQTLSSIAHYVCKQNLTIFEAKKILFNYIQSSLEQNKSFQGFDDAPGELPFNDSFSNHQQANICFGFGTN